MPAELGRLLRCPITGIERIGGGRNSQVYKASSQAGHFALKVYFRHPNDQRDRLATEFGSFTYLWDNGFREIPQPLVSDPKLGWAIYQFIEGDKLAPGQAGEAQVGAAADFLARLKDLSLQPASRNLGAASEAFFAPELILNNLRQRLARLDEADRSSLNGQALRAFLQNEFKPLLARLAPWCESRLQSAGMRFDRELDWELRTLSPSDFGFHNALRRPDGQIIFLDFEYFGWDDPAKMISDFLLHPAMDLSAGSKKTFAASLFSRFSDWPNLRARVESVYPLFGLKWCMIMLNEFLPDQMLRRQFAAAVPADRAALQRQQLDKARRMLDRIGQEYRDFPYHA